ncbi:MAG: DUF2284 domain-containing protein [Oscillospiraceae bacterium]|nr:DUF2284 domain-containing protein [Oscillospiraceae bacterium]
MAVRDDIMAVVKGYEEIADAGILPTGELVFEPGFRKDCEDNVCGCYNANYSCPPYCGTPEEMKNRALRYDSSLTVRTVWDMPDMGDVQRLTACKKRHNDISYEIIDALLSMGLEVDAMLAGHCDRCEGGCLMPRGKPCTRNYKVYSCASAYCLDLTRTCRRMDMPFAFEKDRVSYYSTFLYNEK